MARTSAPKTSASKNIISLKVTLRGVKPPVWRRLLAPGTMTLGDLHKAIQAAMGWRDCHLVDENRPTLNGLLRSSVVRFAYTYDFGEDVSNYKFLVMGLPFVTLNGDWQSLAFRSFASRVFS